MRHAGALRIDHVMGLMRLYWVPRGAGAHAGAYVRYPLDELLAIVRLESHRNRCVVVGEDLGTVPDAVREALARAGVLSYRLLYFQRDASGEFLPARDYPRDALVSIGTHDLPTLAGWWQGRDIELRDSLGLFPDEATRERLRDERALDRRRLLDALARAGRLPAHAGVHLDPDALARGPLTAALVEAIHGWLASTPSRLMMVQPEDWIGALEQNNLPGTVDEHPNWRRKLALSIDELRADAAGAQLAAVLARERPRDQGTSRIAPVVARASAARCAAGAWSSAKRAPIVARTWPAAIAANTSAALARKAAGSALCGNTDGRVRNRHPFLFSRSGSIAGAGPDAPP